MSAVESMMLALVELVDHNQRPPCGYSSDEWLSEDAQQRATACHRCQSCQLLDLCREYGREVHATFGVYGAHDFTPRPRRPK